MTLQRLQLSLAYDRPAIPSEIAGSSLEGPTSCRLSAIFVAQARRTLFPRVQCVLSARTGTGNVFVANCKQGLRPSVVYARAELQTRMEKLMSRPRLTGDNRWHIRGIRLSSLLAAA